MEKRRIGGLDVSLVGLGCNNFGMRLDEDASIAVIHAAIDAGINFLDTADVYGGAGASETIIGKALAGGRRDQVVIGTKFAAPFDGDPPGKGAGAAWIAQAVEGSLRRLQTDRIDLYQQHVFDRDGADRGDPGRARRARRRRQGPRDRIEQLRRRPDRRRRRAQRGQGVAAVRQRAEPLQPARPRGARRRHPGVRAARGSAFLPFFPLASGMLTGKYKAGRGVPRRHPAGVDAGRARRVVRQRPQPPPRRRPRRGRHVERGHTLLELAFAWLTAQPSIASVIAGATSPAQIAANVAAVDWVLTADDLAAVDAALASG